MIEKRFFVGLDLGQAQDYTAISILEQRWSDQPRGYKYDLRYLDRFRGMPYPDVVKKVAFLVRSPKIMGSEPPALVVDKTGVGAPIADMFRQGGVRPVEITISGGNSPSVVPRGFAVPKRDLVFALLKAFQTGQFKIAAGLPLGDTLMHELLNFNVKINLVTSHDSYGAWREGIHDDMVMSVAMAVWYAERRYGGRAK
jgi:hypothetical protein